MRSIPALFTALALSLTVLTAYPQKVQKFGHINSADLLEKMPEVTAADTQLESYQKQLSEQNDAMVNEYKAKLAEFQSGQASLNEVKKEVMVQELTDLEERISNFQQAATDKLSAKKEELYSPILEKAKKAIQDVAKENGYTYVFDTSVGILIEFPASDDMMELVKKKLNIQ